MRLRLVGAALLLALTGCYTDILVTEEPDAFFSPRPLRTGQVDVGLRTLPTEPERLAYGVSAAGGVGRGWEVRAGWARTGWHWRGSDSTELLLTAVELRGRRQLIEDGPFRLAVGGGCDLFIADPGNGDPVEYYGLRPMLQAAAGIYTDYGFGMFFPLAVSGSFLRPEQAVGWSITPGAGFAFEHKHFFVRVAGNIPLGSFIETEGLRLRMMAPSAGLELGGRIMFSGGARNRD